MQPITNSKINKITYIVYIKFKVFATAASTGILETAFIKSATVQQYVKPLVKSLYCTLDQPVAWQTSGQSISVGG